MALSDDLRKRVVEAVVLGGLSPNAGRQAFRCEHRKRGALGDALQDHGADFAFAFRGRSPVRPYRGAARLFARLDPPHAGHHAARDPRANSAPTATFGENTRAPTTNKKCLLDMIALYCLGVEFGG